MWLSPHKEGTRCALTRTHTVVKNPASQKRYRRIGFAIRSSLMASPDCSDSEDMPLLPMDIYRHHANWLEKKMEWFKIKMQAVGSPPGKHTTQRTHTENIQPDLGADIAADINLDGSPGRGAETRSASTHRAPKRRRHKAALCSLLLLLGFP